MTDRSKWRETAEVTQPWVIYVYGRTHDKWWPFWSSTRALGYARIGLECCVCGHTEVVKLRIPRIAAIPEPKSGRHPERERFLDEHGHQDRGHPMSWARPLRNVAVFDAVGGLDLDLLAGRIEADMRDGKP